jgi:hypothetical protein
LRGKYWTDESRLTLPFLVYGIACEPVKISVTLRIGAHTESLTRVVPLACGE